MIVSYRIAGSIIILRQQQIRLWWQKERVRIVVPSFTVCQYPIMA
jgi:hypothetical protein